MPLSVESQRLLGFLQLHYGGEYEVTAVPGNWQAVRRVDGRVLEQGSAAMLITAINTDRRERRRARENE